MASGEVVRRGCGSYRVGDPKKLSRWGAALQVLWLSRGRGGAPLNR